MMSETEVAEVAIKMGPSDDNKEFHIEIVSKVPMLMEQVACFIYALFLKHCEQIKLDPEKVVEAQKEPPPQSELN